MKLEELREFLPLYALDALPPEERLRVEKAIKEHPEVWPELRALLETAASLTSFSRKAPAPELKAKVLARIAREQQNPGRADLQPQRARPGLLWPRFLAQAAMAAVVILILWGGSFVWTWIQAFGDPTTKVITLVDENNHPVGRVIMKHDGNTLVWVRMPPPPKGKTYQLWGINGEQHLPLSTFKGGLIAFKLPPGSQTVHITEESSGGSLTPTQIRALPQN